MTRGGYDENSPNGLSMSFLLFNADIEYEISRGWVPCDATPVPTTHDELALRLTTVGIHSKDRKLSLHLCKEGDRTNREHVALPCSHQCPYDEVFDVFSSLTPRP